MTWRETAQIYIARAITNNPDLVDDTKAMRKAINEYYPFGERRRYPYKVWLEELKTALWNLEQESWRRKQPKKKAVIPRPQEDHLFNDECWKV